MTPDTAACDLTDGPHTYVGGPSALADHLRDSRDWWRSEWEHKNREAEWLWLACLALGVLCGVAFFVGTVVG
jgi:hypothetical protein